MKLINSLGEVALGSRFKMLSDSLYNSVDSVYKSLDINFQSRWFLFIHLLHKNRCMGITELAKEIEQSHSAVSQTSNILLKKGLIKSSKDKNDERRRLLSLSDEGEILYIKLVPIFEAIKKSMTQIILNSNSDVMKGIEKFETQLIKTPFHEEIIKRLDVSDTTEVEIVEYTNEFKTEFKRLNIEWLQKFFYVEEFDNEVLSNPEKYILNEGGFIYYAKYNSEIVGTCALMKDKNNTWELTKMAVSEKYQGLRMGEKLARAVINKFLSFNSGTLFLETNSKLIPAIKLYEKLGFLHQENTKDGSHYNRADVYMIYANK